MSFTFGRVAVPQLPVPETQFWGSREGLCAAEAILFIAKGALTSVTSCVQCGWGTATVAVTSHEASTLCCAGLWAVGLQFDGLTWSRGHV